MNRTERYTATVLSQTVNNSKKRDSSTEYLITTTQELTIFLVRFIILIVGLVVVAELEAATTTQKTNPTTENNKNKYTLENCINLYKLGSKEALDICKTFAKENNNQDAYFLTAQIYKKGFNGTPQDNLYIQYLNTAAELGQPAANREIGLIGLGFYLDSKTLGTGKNAIESLNKAVELKDEKAKAELAKAKSYKEFEEIIEYDPEQSHKELTQLYEKENNRDAGFYLSYNYYHGNGIKEDKHKSILILNDLTQKNFPKAFLSLAQIYLNDKDLYSPVLSYAYYFAYATCNKSSKNFGKSESVKKLIKDPKELEKAKSITKELLKLECTMPLF